MTWPRTADDYLDRARAACPNGCGHARRDWACARCQRTAQLMADAVNEAKEQIHAGD